jgi:hypothetical protein
MMEPSTQAQELPPELAQRLHRLAAAEMSESRPWPGVDNAVRRLHRRRVAGISAVAASCAVIIGVTFSSTLGLSSDRSQPAPPAGPQTTATATAPAGPLPASGFAGPVGGSLASDQAWLAQVRRRVTKLVLEEAKTRRETEIFRSKGSAAVQVLWTADLDGFRYAYTIYPMETISDHGPIFTEALLSGPAGASADQLDFTPNSGSSGDQPGEANARFEFTRPASTHPDLLLVMTPPAFTKVEVASGRTFSLNGTSTTTWRTLRREGGAVWVGQLTPGEAYLGELRSAGGDILSSSNQPFPSHAKRAAAIAPAGSNLDAIRFAGVAVGVLRPSLEEKAVLSTSRRLTDTAHLAATVFTSPEGVALVGFDEHDLKSKATSSPRHQGAAAIARQPLADLDTFMIAVSAKKRSSAGYLVLTPKGATSARIGDVTVPVSNRLARFERSAAPGGGQVTVEALNAQGEVIGTVVSVKGK